MSEIPDGLSMGPASPVAAARMAPPVPRGRIPGSAVPSANALAFVQKATERSAVAPKMAVDRMAEL